LCYVKSSNISALLLIVAVVCLVLAVYYLIPGIYHPFTSSPPNESHKTHALAFAVIAVVAFLGARFARSSASNRP